jgi:nucleoside-triphosphatase THEP1
MVIIVTGNINSYKTTKLVELFGQVGGDGFVAVKKMIGDQVHSYNSIRLTTGESKLLVLRDEFAPNGFVKQCQIGPYLFSKTTTMHIEAEIRKLIKQKKAPIFLDEIGVLELSGQCFANILTEMVESGLDLCLCMRKDVLQQVITKFNIGEHIIIE